MSATLLTTSWLRAQRWRAQRWTERRTRWRGSAGCSPPSPGRRVYGQDRTNATPRHVGSGVRAGPLQEVRRERSGVGRRLTPIIGLLAGLASVLGLVAAAPIAVAQPTARSGIEA